MKADQLQWQKCINVESRNMSIRPDLMLPHSSCVIHLRTSIVYLVSKECV